MNEVKLYIVGRVGEIGYDQFDSMVVAAYTEEQARTFHPMESGDYYTVEDFWEEYHSSWVRKDDIDTLDVKCIGIADKRVKVGVIHTSYCAG